MTCDLVISHLTLTLDPKIKNKKKIEIRRKENRIKLSPTSIILIYRGFGYLVRNCRN